jgi:dienelactone hydrolase
MAKYYMEKTQRLRDQKWIIDKIIQMMGVDSIMPWIGKILATAGLDLQSDITDFKARVKKYDDTVKELVRIAVKRETMAKKAEQEGHLVTARDNYFSAAICYFFARVIVHEDNVEDMIKYNNKKNECYDKYIQNAPHPVERVEIPFGDKFLPGILHMPRNRTQKVPCIIELGGVEILKEVLNNVYNDKYLERGLAVLSFDLPGQGEARMRDILFNGRDFVRAGQAAMDFLIKRPEIDIDKIAIRGVSLGSRISPQIVARDNRFKAIAVHGSGFGKSGGGYTIANPTLKDKMMWMHGYHTEEEFDKAPKRPNEVEEIASKITCPFLIIAGEDDDVSPIEDTYDFFNQLKAPKKLIVYQGEGHGIRHTYDVDAMIADWLKDRLDGKPMQSENIYVDLTGKEIQKEI